VPSSTLADTETYLLGPVLGFAQRLMGILCLHASAVMIDGVAVALCGPAGAGKSTTAGAFASAGFGVLADDMTPIRMRDGVTTAMPGYDHLRVWQETEEILLGTTNALPRLTPTWDKRALQMRGQGWTWCEEPARLGAVVLLAPRMDTADAPRIDPMQPGEAFVSIAANSYANYLLDDRMRAGEFAAIARLMHDVQVVRATPHADPERLGALMRAIVGAIRA
jgi:serine kinase of HPr protein (carbohydrate metabolism regulator)